jgi:hypothetical protein
MLQAGAFRRRRNHHGQDSAQADDLAAGRARRTPYLVKDPNHAFSIDDLKAFERTPFPTCAFETIKFLYEERGVIATGY